MRASLSTWYEGLFVHDPWTNVYALARSLTAAALLITLSFNSVDTLFAPNEAWESPKCDGWLRWGGLFCVAPSLAWGKALAVVVLLLVVIGYLPRWTALPHVWVSVSLHNSMSMTEGGDQIAAIIALLISPIALLDSRRWHWTFKGGPVSINRSGEIRRMIANTSAMLIRLQVSVIYLHAAIGKLAVEEWVNGTAVYYWVHDPQFGPSGLRATVAEAVVSTALGVVLLTWGTLVLELALAYGLVASAPLRKALFWAGVLFHAGIAMVLGLVTFGITMSGALLLYLWPRESSPDINVHEYLYRRFSKRFGGYDKSDMKG
ncbi:sporulation-delaying protein SdpB family protein [Nocardiopsis sp. CC223A]|uniref:sporulation-delaying protein SdpB family protein n=1 Tax=Nocardiopsis sp. CC223A TaxID=3044051 RepID=UPI00278C07AD|nr:sporulation-delaying protein SdpB family protein [Nocardiopsis sp. CC223A]